MGESKIRQRRQCGTKVKTGCQTCKIRRVKCDEGKPFCKRCTSTGRKCDGYGSDALRSPDNGRAMTMVARITTSVPGSSAEKRGFQYFLRNTAIELTGYYDKGFWEYLLLQASTTEPSLRHAVVAIGSLHEDFSNRKLQYSAENSGFAIDQYTKAIGHLRRSLATGKQAPLTALMSCILFVCFDSIRGHFTTAMVHLQSGLRILRSLRGRSTADDLVIKNTIAPIFWRLSVQAILYVDTRDGPNRRAFASELMRTSLSERSVPECFQTLEDARNSLNQAADGLFRMFYLCDGELPYCYQPIESFELYDRYSAQLRDWNFAFERFMKAKGHAFDSKQIRGAALLKILHTTANIMAQASVPNIEDPRTISEAVNSPGVFEAFKKDFQNVVNLSRSLIAAAELDAKNGKASLTFSADLGVIAPLYYAATHCADNSVRKESLDLLSRCPRREGMWDGEAATKMIQEYWSIEETHKILQEGSVDGPVPLSEVVDLEMKDGMVWEWKWKDPTIRSRASTPGHVWSLDDQSLFGELYEVTEAFLHSEEVVIDDEAMPI